MQKMAKFSKVSVNQFAKDWLDAFPALADGDMSAFEINAHIQSIYDGIKLPKRATIGSAGYDFFAPMSFTLEPNESIKIPTGIRCEMYDGWVLMEFPRSGHGFKYGLTMANTVGIIDGDYAFADNEGHIMIKLTNCSSLAKTIKFNAGDAFCQGIFVPFGITLDDEVDAERTGGFGSTDN